MTTRSTRSTRSTVKPAESMTDGDVYVFLLQIAVLSGVAAQQQQQRKADAAAAVNARPGRSESAAKKPSDYGGAGSASASSSSSSLTPAWTSLGGLMDLVSTSSREARFPEKLIKRLNDRLERIIKGQDPSYNDHTLRATIARFYGTFKEDGFQRCDSGET